MSGFDEAMGLSPDAADHADIARHVLGQTILPVTVQDVQARFDDAARLGAVLPSGRFHRDVADVAATLTKLAKMGLVKALSGFESFEAMILASNSDPDLVDNDQDPEDAPHAKGAYYQTESRGALWATNQTNSGATLGGKHWQMTKAGFRLLTGHDQGEDKAIRAANEAAAAAAAESPGEPADDDGGAE